MYVDLNTIITWGSVAGVLAALGGFVYKFVNWLSEQKEQSEKIKLIQEEQTVICFSLLAALDGLKQLGANGEVTKAHDYLSKHINKKAHNQE